MRFSYSLKGILIYFLLAIVFLACENTNLEKEKESVDYAELRTQMLDANKKFVVYEDEIIKKYIKHKVWKMEETGSGLRWMILKNGKGERARSGQFVSLEYQIYLLSGELIYSSENTGLKKFQVGQGGVESGLEEGVLFLKLGDKARFILPSHLAYGLLGDRQSIPEKASLLYEVKLIDLE